MANSHSSDESNLIDLEPSFLEKNKGAVLVGIVAIVLVIGGVTGWNYYQDAREGNAQAALASAKSPKDKIAAAKEFIGTAQAAVALLQAAGAQADAQSFQEAADTYQLFLSNYPQHPLKNGALLGLAQAQEALQKTPEAIAIYQQIISGKADSYSLVAQLNLASLYGTQKKYKEARQVLESLQQQNPQSPFASQAKDALSRLPN